MKKLYLLVGFFGFIVMNNLGAMDVEYSEMTSTGRYPTSRERLIKKAEQYVKHVKEYGYDNDNYSRERGILLKGKLSVFNLKASRQLNKAIHDADMLVHSNSEDEE